MKENTAMNIDVQTGTSAKTKKPWKALKITIGDWSTLIFPKSKFEMDYIEKVIEENK